MDPDTRIGGPRDAFPSTGRTLLEAAATGLDPAALDRIAALYWKPVYRFLRLKFHKENEDAKDLTQSFFATALERDLFTRFDPSKASFRTYLRMAVERFAASDHASQTRQKRGAGAAPDPLDHSIPASADTPEEAFDKEWRRQLFCLALDDLQSLCATTGKHLEWQVFSAYDLADPPRPSYRDLAAQFAIPEHAVTNHLAWSRRTLRRLVEDRLTPVTSGPGELRSELRRVWLSL